MRPIRTGEGGEGGEGGERQQLLVLHFERSCLIDVRSPRDHPAPGGEEAPLVRDVAEDPHAWQLRTMVINQQSPREVRTTGRLVTAERPSSVGVCNDASIVTD